MELSTYFEPVDTTIVDFQSREFRPMLGDSVLAHTDDDSFPDIEAAQLVLLGVKEDRASTENPGWATASPPTPRRGLSLSGRMRGWPCWE